MRCPRLRVSLLFGLCLACASPPPVEEAPTATATPLEGCVPGEPTAAALLPSGPTEGGGAVVPIGRLVTPAGLTIDTHEWPLAAAFSPDGAYAYVAHNGKRLSVIDVAAGLRLQSLNLPAYRGVAVSPDGQTVFVAGAASGRVHRLARQDDGKLEALDPWSFGGFISTLELSPDGASLYVMSNGNSRIWRVDPVTGDELGQLVAGIYPYDLAVAADGTTVYVSNASGDDVSVLDFAASEEIALIPVDLNPMGLVLSADGQELYVANSDSDTLTVIDTVTLEIVDGVDMRLVAGDPPGASPNELALSADGQRLFVSQADLNLVNVVDLSAREIVGRVPAGFYTTGLAVSPAGDRLLVCNSKGVGSVGGSPNDVTGSVSLVDLPLDDEALAAHTATAEANNLRMRGFYPNDCAYPVPSVMAEGDERPIEHVVLILKENKTYDAVLGDLGSGNGDPALAVFGEPYTPNAHALARRFANLDNYYADSEHSTQGHNWATQADANDLFEKTDYTQNLLIGYDPSIIAHETTVFDHFYDHDVSFRVYGQFVGIAKDMFDKYEPFVNQKVPFFNQSIRDVLKAKEFIRELELGIFPSFVFLALPNDHTYGTKVGKPTPEVMVADNDHALGLAVEAISKSPYWEKTVIFVFQDDAQGYGGDHVHPQRSICLVIGPWVKPGHTSSVHYSMPSVFRTIEMLFGLPPMNLNTAQAAAMYDVFQPGDGTATLDTSPYEAIEPDVPYAVNDERAFMAAESEAIGFEQVDDAPGLGYILWHHMKGPDVQPPPYAKWIDE